MKFKTLIFLTAFIVFSHLTHAATIQLPTTGQTTSFTTGDDGNLQKGVPWPSPRFTDNGDGTITDNLTGLMWLQDANCIKTNYPSFDTEGTAGDGMVSWQNGLNFVAGINDSSHANCGAGYTDWALPNINELQSLVNAEQGDVDTWLITQGFTNVEPNNYWSSTSEAFRNAYAWYLRFPTGYFHTWAKTSSQPYFYIWPVRGVTKPPAKVWKTGQATSYAPGDDGDLQRGAAWPSPRFTDNGDGTVTDNLTGLMWLQDASCFGAVSGVATAAGNLSDFNSGIGTSACSGYTASFSDWRIPNLKELVSLIDRSQYGPTLPLGHPFIKLYLGSIYTGGYLTGTSMIPSSTTKTWVRPSSANDERISPNNSVGYLWVVGMNYGEENSFFGGVLWPVRDATAPGNSVTLTVNKSGSGSGAVTADTGTLAWNGNKGTAAYNTGTSLTLTATPNTGSTFTGWSGSGCSGTGTCVVAMDSAKNVNAVFTLDTYSLTVTKAGAGIGTVTTDTGTLTWAGAGSATYGHGTTVTLTASPNIGYGFAGWSGGGCSGTGTCVLTMTSAQSVTATFEPVFTLSVTTYGQGSGVITPGSGTLTWKGNTGTGPFIAGAPVTLTATSNTGSGFTGWTGGGCSGIGPCVVTMTAAQNVTATFDITSYPLTVTKIGSGSGVVTANPGTLTWTANAGAATYNKNANVILSAIPNSGSTFAGWTGGGCGSAIQCAASMSAAISITAVFQTSHAGAIQLPQTGVNTCDDASGYSTTCAGTGQDGEYQNGIPWPSPRFTDHGDGTITDNLTGLMWLKNSNCMGLNYPKFDNDGTPGDGIVTWQTAVAFVKDLNKRPLTYIKCGAGYQDWAIPNINELLSLMNRKAPSTSGWLNGQGLSVSSSIGRPGLIKGSYWSGSYNAKFPDRLWLSSFAQDKLMNAFKTDLTLVWPVRAGGSSGYADVGKTGQTTCYDVNGMAIPCAGTGQDGDNQRGVAWPTPRFTDNLDGTVTDHLTGFMWLKDAGCFQNQTWTGALAKVSDFNLNPGTYKCSGYTASYSNWRLPNNNELQSLSDLSTYAPALSKGHPFVNVPTILGKDNFWSSTPHALKGQYQSAWYFNSTMGIMAEALKRSTYNGWAVRSGGVSGSTLILTVTKAGTGAGSVTANPGNLTWNGSTGNARYNSGTSVTLSATPTGGSTFTGWSGGGCSGTGKCVVTLNSAQSVTGAFSGKSVVSPDIKANGSDGPITIPRNNALIITISLNAHGDTSNVDWWVLAGTSSNNLYHYNLGAGTFLPGATITHKGPLFDLPSYQVLKYSFLGPGVYTFTFGVDYTPDGAFTNKSGQLFYDSVVVTVK